MEISLVFGYWQPGPNSKLVLDARASNLAGVQSYWGSRGLARRGAAATASWAIPKY
jgi:hypothetical protein